MTYCASRFMSLFMSFNDALDLVLFRPNPVGFVPVDFRMAHRTIEEFHVGVPFSFLQRPLPYAFHSRLRSRIAVPDAIDSTFVMRPTILKRMHQHRYSPIGVPHP